MAEISNKKAVVIILVMLLFAIVVLILVYEEVRYNTIQDDYEYLENDYNSLQTKYNSLTTNYDNLVNQYTELNEDYNVFLETTLQYSQLPIDHLMELTYNEIREQCQPKYYYQKPPSEYAAVVCAHDLGRLYWPSIEDDYYDATGNQLGHDAHSRITKIIDIIDISEYSSNAEKIDKILNFINSNINYQSDLNNEFLFPTETITFRSGDCDDFSILAATLFEEVGIESAIGSFESENIGHYMVLVNLPDLGDYGYWHYDDLTTYGLSDGKWIILEPQSTIEMQYEEDWISKWDLITAHEILNE